MRDLATVVERLRLVRRAQQRFLALSMLEREIIGPMLLDRVGADLDAGQGPDLSPGPNSLYPQPPGDDKS